MVTTTPNYALDLPVPLSPIDANVWGPYVNSNTSFTDGYFLSLANNFFGTVPPTIPATGQPSTGQFWINNTVAGNWPVSVYDGTNWVAMGFLNSTTHIFKPVSGSLVINQIPITSSVVYTPSAGLQYAIVEVVGGGAGGAGSINGAGTCVGGAGGGGGYARTILSAATIGASQIITIGAGGAGGAAGTNSGINGGTTSFGTFAVATGGFGGFTQINLTDPFDATIGGLGGNGTSGGSLLVTGGNGQLSVFRGSPNTRLFGWAGAGGTSMWSGGAPTSNAANGAGNNAGGFGGGGSGGISTTVSNPGGAGSQGAVVVTEYITA